jgi:glycosyltransferase involved in cell wall biosynthesis
MLHRQQEVRDDPFADMPNIAHRYVDIGGDRWNAWQRVRLPMAARSARADVLHAPANTAPPFPLVPMVVTIHDLIPIDFGPPTEETRRWRRDVAVGARKARRIITPSTYTKERLIEQFGVDDRKITVNPWAPDTSCRAVTDAGRLAAVRERYGMGGRPYLFGFGAADPRKNTPRILEAWAGLDAAVRDRMGLLLVGLEDEKSLAEMRALASRLAPGGGWSLTGFAPEADLPALMSGSVGVCYVSLREGFGLPILDAFACGAPVITSATTSLPEVAGDAALIVDPEDVSAIRAAMQSLATDDALRARLRERGAERLPAFSWERCARTAAGVLEGVAGEVNA